LAARETIHEYYLHQHRNIEYYLELCLNHADAELVHELRLSIKKLRAFHKMAEFLYLKDVAEPVHIRNRVRQLYKIAGQLRDTQVQIQLLATFEEQTGIVYQEFNEWLRRREKKQISHFGKNPKQVVPKTITQSTRQKIDNVLAVSSEESILISAGKALSCLYSKARELSANELNDRKLHRIRTITKRMRYILTIMHHSFPDFKFNEISVDLLRDIEVTAGNWHDNLVRIELLRKFLDTAKITDDSEKFKYQKLLNACKSELDISFSETLGLVRKALRSEVSEIKI
jgi:CHAD domain-containing protein